MLLKYATRNIWTTQGQENWAIFIAFGTTQRMNQGL